jgi:thiol-disulfide isomerase/thioredoxin
MKTRQYGIIVGILVTQTALLIGIGCEKKTEDDSRSGKTNNPAPQANTVKSAPDENTITEAHAFPSLTFTSLSGNQVNLDSLKGKVVLIDFWATWCSPCVRALPDLIATYKEYHDQGFEIIGINLDKDQAKLQQYLKDNEITWPQYFDGLGWSNKLAKRFGIRGIPHIVLIDKKGAVHFNTNYAKDKFPLHGEDLKNAVAELLK